MCIYVLYIHIHVLVVAYAGYLLTHSITDSLVGAADGSTDAGSPGDSQSG